MQEVVKFILGIAVLILGIPIGNLLARLTKEELGPRKIWFVMIILLCFAGAILGLILQDDTLLFTLLFIAIVTSRSLRNPAKKEVRKNVKKKKVNVKKRK
jgi:uncharacterized membrane protein YoaK (UPF0700 family)